MTEKVTVYGKDRPVDRIKMILSTDSVRQQFQNVLSENAGAFVASILDLYASDKTLQECDPAAVVMEALKAASLKLPINKQLGLAYIVPYGKAPTFQIGYRGYVQLALRTGQYRHLNAGTIYEGVTVNRDILTGEISFSGEAKGTKAQGHFAHLELLNGFRKTVYMTAAEMLAHAKKYSKSFGKTDSAWTTSFEQMANKTMIRRLLSQYGILSVEMIAALTADSGDDTDLQADAEPQVIDVTPAPKAAKKAAAPQAEAESIGINAAFGPDF